MSKARISIKKLLSGEDRRVDDMVAELEASEKEHESAPLWTERLSASTKGGTCKLGG